MQINPKYIELLRESELNKAKGLFFGFLIFYRKEYPELENYILDDHVLPYDDFQVYQINLCRLNTDTGEMELKVPFFSFQKTGEFEQLLQLLNERFVFSTGYLNNPLQFSIFEESNEADLAEVKGKIGESFNLTKLADVIAKYYSKTQYATKLSKYLRSPNVIQDYDC